MTTKTTPERLNDLEAEAFRTGRSLADLHEAVRGVAADAALIRPLANKVGAVEEDMAATRSDVRDIRHAQARQGAMLEAIMTHLGLPVPPVD